MNAPTGSADVWHGAPRLLLAGLMLSLFSAAGAAPGKKIFIEHKCNQCHTVNTEGIARAEDEDEDETDDAPPDLSGVGDQLDAEKMDGWLRKKVAIDGDKHPKRFAGSDAERKVLIDWLRQTKPDPKAREAPKK
jgi:hypothetical protein